MTITREIGKSMVVQLDRVKASHAYKLSQELEERDERIEWLTQELRALRTENQSLREIVDALPEDHPGVKHLMNWDKRKMGNRPVISIAEAARQANVSYWTAYRYVVVYQDWSAIQTDDRQWLVYADQPLNVKTRKKGKGKKK